MKNKVTMSVIFGMITKLLLYLHMHKNALITPHKNPKHFSSA